jgi:hypothetical protein
MAELKELRDRLPEGHGASGLLFLHEGEVPLRALPFLDQLLVCDALATQLVEAKVVGAEREAGGAGFSEGCAVVAKIGALGLATIADVDFEGAAIERSAVVVDAVGGAGEKGGGEKVGAVCHGD